jgi:hypothetical protein
MVVLTTGITDHTVSKPNIEPHTQGSGEDTVENRVSISSSQSVPLLFPQSHARIVITIAQVPLVMLINNCAWNDNIRPNSDLFVCVHEFNLYYYKRKIVHKYNVT